MSRRAPDRDDLLITRLGGQMIVRPRQSQQLFGWCHGTSRKMMARGELPALRHFGGKLTGWLVPELLEHFANAPPSRLVGPRSPGRPRKSAKPDDALRGKVAA